MPKLFVIDIASASDLKVFVTDIRSEADLIVYETTDEWAATESPIWCYTDIQSEADKTIYFADSPFDAEWPFSAGCFTSCEVGPPLARPLAADGTPGAAACCSSALGPFGRVPAATWCSAK